MDDDAVSPSHAPVKLNDAPLPCANTLPKTSHDPASSDSVVISAALPPVTPVGDEVDD